MQPSGHWCEFVRLKEQDRSNEKLKFLIQKAISDAGTSASEEFSNSSGLSVLKIGLFWSISNNPLNTAGLEINGWASAKSFNGQQKFSGLRWKKFFNEMKFIYQGLRVCALIGRLVCSKVLARVIQFRFSVWTTEKFSLQPSNSFLVILFWEYR